MKPRHLVLGASLLVAAAFAFFGDTSPPAALVEAAPRRAAVAAGATPRSPTANVSTSTSTSTSNGASAGIPQVLALVPRERLMEEGARADSAFAVRNWNPPPPSAAPAPPPPPPTAPPLPFVFLGKALENGAWDVFLARGSETLIVRQQMVIDGLYRIDAIAPPLMTITYLPLKQVQQIQIGVPE